MQSWCGIPYSSPIILLHNVPSILRNKGCLLKLHPSYPPSRQPEADRQADVKLLCKCLQGRTPSSILPEHPLNNCQIHEGINFEVGRFITYQTILNFNRMPRVS